MRLGVDFGGTKVEAAALAADGSVLLRRRVPSQRGYPAAVRTVAELVGAVEAELGRRAPAVGVGIPGSVSPADGLIRNANSTFLIGQDFERDLTQALDRPVRLENDANCFALAEAMAGAGRGARTVFGVILGTGVGSGIVIDGRVLSGHNRIAGEWGHNRLPLPPEEAPGPTCYCGRVGCIEAWCSGPALAADHQRVTGEALDAVAIAAKAREGDAAARATLARHAGRLARGLAGVVNILDPDAIVLGGGLSKLEHLYRELPAAMRPHVFSDVFETPILKPELGDSAGVIGAAWLWPAGAGAPA